jgi:hypothetical protein
MIFKAIKKGIKKLARGIKKVVKKIGKGIKSAFQKIGKFMGKIGIVGQIAMMFILPGIGSALSKGLSKGWSALIGKSATMTTAGTTATVTAGSGLLGGNAVMRGVGHVLQAAGNFVKVGHSAFKTVTGAVGSFVKEFAGTALKKIPGMQKLMPSLQNAPDTFFQGKDSAWSKVSQKVITDGKALVADFNKAIGYTPPPKGVPVSEIPEMIRRPDLVDTKPSVDLKAATEVPESILDVKGLDGKPIRGDMLGTATTETTSLLEPQVKLATPENILDVKGIDGAPLRDSMMGDLTSTVAEKTATPFYPTPDGTLTAAKAADPGFLSRLGTSTKEAIMSIPDKIVEAPGKFVEGLDKTVQKGLQNKVLVETGLVEEPVTNVVYEGSTVVPDMASTPFMAQYGSPEINDRAYQMSLNPSSFSMSNPWGNPASTYQHELGVRV